ncbi:F-box/SPRY domain-containing protein 1-like [Clavelina lepadiformis]|uniref:F-box/SPRY domain-containing protein 1 n=1 Tax=Clavelina lepadiformis TaxID=159417 RepID=A0ABP0FTW0_CLALP
MASADPLLYVKSPTADQLPNRVLEQVFSFLSLEDLQSCSLVCKTWFHYLNDGNNDVWRLQCVRKLAEATLKSDLWSSQPTYKEKLRAFYHSWNADDCSGNIYIKPDGFTLHRRPEAQCTDGARGRIGFDSGRHSWDVRWKGPLGTVAMVGVATKEAPLRSRGYQPLLGSSDQSWAWNLVDNYLFHGGTKQDPYPKCNNPPKYQVGEKITVVLDMEDNTLAFERDYEFLGIAFRGLPRTRLYPSISAVYGNTEVTMVYRGNPTDG